MVKINALIIPVVVLGIIIILIGISYDWNWKELLGAIAILFLSSWFYGFVHGRMYERPPKKKTEEIQNQ